MLRFWALDADKPAEGELFTDTREYGFNFKDRAGNEPVMMESAFARGFDKTLKPDGVTEETFRFAVPPTAKRLSLYASLTYIYFVPPPGEMVERMQAAIAQRMERASEREKAKILEVEIPARMEAMHTLTSTYPDIVMAQTKRHLVLRP